MARSDCESFRKVLIGVIIFLTDGTGFARVSGDKITAEIIHFICTISNILAWPFSKDINV